MASSSVSTSKGSTVDCYCKRPAVLGTSGTTINPGRQFWGCCNWKVKEKSCGYFRWADQIAAEVPTYTKPLTGRAEMNSRMTFVDRDEWKLAMYPLVAFLSGLLVGIFLGFLLAKL